MPDLMNLKSSLLGRYLTGSLVGLCQSRDRKTDLSLRLATRLLDKAIGEYREARGRVLLAVRENAMTFEEIQKSGDGQHLYEIGVINHLENCFNALGRVYLLLPEIALSEVSPKIRSMRNMVEHMDERIKEGDVAGPIGLDMGQDGVEIKIFFRDRYDKDKEEILILNTVDLASELERIHAALLSQL